MYTAYYSKDFNPFGIQNNLYYNRNKKKIKEVLANNSEEYGFGLIAHLEPLAPAEVLDFGDLKSEGIKYRDLGEVGVGVHITEEDVERCIKDIQKNLLTG